MVKNMDKELKKKLRKHHAYLFKTEDIISRAYDVLDEAKFLAKCRTCEKEVEYSTKPFSERYISCRTTGACVVVADAAKSIKRATTVNEEAREEYGRIVFKILQEFNPVLVSIRDASEKNWSDVFGTDYEALSPEQKVSLIALTEFDGGLYRLKGIDQIFDD